MRFYAYELTSWLEDEFYKFSRCEIKRHFACYWEPTIQNDKTNKRKRIACIDTCIPRKSIPSEHDTVNLPRMFMVKVCLTKWYQQLDIRPAPRQILVSPKSLGRE